MKLALRPVKPGRGPAHAQIEDALVRAIARLEPGTRLPPERELAERLRVSRMTVRHALASLERRGLVGRRVGRGGGTFTAEPKLELMGTAALSDQLRALGLAAGARVVSTREVESPLGDAYEVVRVRLADGEPVALERTLLAADAFPGLLELPLDGSLYELMRERYDEAPVRAVERLEPALADAEAAATLKIGEGDPVLAVERATFAASGRQLELGRDVFRGDRVRVVWETQLA